MSTATLVYLVFLAITAYAAKPLLRRIRALRTGFSAGAAGIRWFTAAAMTALAGALWLLVLLTTLDGWISSSIASSPKTAIEIIWPLGMLFCATLTSVARPPADLT